MSFANHGVTRAGASAALLGAGASLGTALVLHDSLDQRRREVATLRLLGFDSRAVAASVLMEGLCLSVLGSLLGVALAWLWLDGTLVNGAWSIFRITVDLQLLCVAVIWGAGIALAGSMPLILGTLRQTALDAIHDLFIALARVATRSAA
ncbi:MAG: FtsX-like permease family protein [Pseudomonadota bacterium]